MEMRSTNLLRPPVYNPPGDRDRHLIVGATGSGKTWAAVAALSRKNFDTKPWIVYDPKYDDLINKIENRREIELTDPVPKYPGLYVVHPEPDQDELLEAQLLDIWKHEDVGVYFDEGGMVQKGNKGFRNMLTQGRSKHIPMVILTQRPVWIDRYAFSESEYKQVFRLSTEKDVIAMQDSIPHRLQMGLLPEYHSYYYDVKRNTLGILPPGPDENAILDTFDFRLGRMKKVV